jgi:hypothetical protein
MSKLLPINSAARNSVWVYPRSVPPRFPGAPTLIETTRSYERPDFGLLPTGSEVSVEFYDRAYSLWMDGNLCRVYIRRFEYVSFPTEEEIHSMLSSPSGGRSSIWSQPWRSNGWRKTGWRSGSESACLLHSTIQALDVGCD